jgi:hypothetical protein
MIIRNIIQDILTGALVEIDFGHYKVHQGLSFYYHDVIALGNGATQDYIITIPDSMVRMHFGMEINYNDGAGIIELYEATDRVGTTLQTTFNRDRNSGNIANMLVHKDQSGGTTDGVKIINKRSGSGKTLAGESATGEERILRNNTKYLLRLTNGTTSTNNVNIILRWYEHRLDTIKEKPKSL